MRQIPKRGAFYATRFSCGPSRLALNPARDLPRPTIQTGDGDLNFDNPVEPVILGDHDITHLQHLFYPEGKDIDLFKFELQDTGLSSAEIAAERLAKSSEFCTLLMASR